MMRCVFIKQPENPSLEWEFMKILINELWDIVESFSSFFFSSNKESSRKRRRWSEKLQNNIYKWVGGMDDDVNVNDMFPSCVMKFLSSVDDELVFVFYQKNRFSSN